MRRAGAKGVEPMSRLRLAEAVVAGLVLAACAGGPAAGEEATPLHAGTRLLRSGGMLVEIGDPNSGACRWNQGTRFSPVANILRVQFCHREFLYAPVGGGALGYTGGLPMEFDIGQETFQPDPPGYNEGANGTPFLKIGVGILRRDGGAYDFSKSYPVIEAGRITVMWQPDRARFVQTLAGNANGYSCRLEEDVVVKNDRLILKYLLRNTGTRPFTTEQYLHNFLCFSGRSVGPSVRLSFPYNFTTTPAVGPWLPPPPGRVLEVASAATVVRIANTLEYMEKATSVPKIWVYKPEGYAGPERFAVEHMDLQHRVAIEASLPAAYVGLWSTDYQISPEQFLIIKLAPGEEREFTRTYTFRLDGSVPQDATGDGTVDINDLSLTSGAWLTEPGAAGWLAACDVSDPADDRIDLRDLAALARAWRQDEGLPAPVAQWTFDESAGATAHDARARADASLYNFPEDGSQWVAGVSAGGLQCDGTDDYAEAAGDFGISKIPRTVTAWVKSSEKPTASQTILAWGAPAAGQHWLLEVDAKRRLRFSCGAGYALATRLIGDTQWHHIAVALDPLVRDQPRMSDIRLYVDARPQPVYEMAEAALDATGGRTLHLGAPFDPSESQPFPGVLDDVRLYDTVLCPAHVRQIYMATLSP
jgi:hypothetical protein